MFFVAGFDLSCISCDLLTHILFKACFLLSNSGYVCLCCLCYYTRRSKRISRLVDSAVSGYCEIVSIQSGLNLFIHVTW